MFAGRAGFDPWPFRKESEGVRDPCFEKPRAGLDWPFKRASELIHSYLASNFWNLDFVPNARLKVEDTDASQPTLLVSSHLPSTNSWPIQVVPLGKTHTSLDHVGDTKVRPVQAFTMLMVKV